MTKPENEMIFMVLEPKETRKGETIYTGFLGINSVSASFYNEKLYIRLQKWPKKDQTSKTNDFDQRYQGDPESLNEHDVSF